MADLSEPRPAADEEPPPFLGSWRRLYAGILLYLAGLIVLFYIFMRAFS